MSTPPRVHDSRAGANPPRGRTSRVGQDVSLLEPDAIAARQETRPEPAGLWLPPAQIQRAELDLDQIPPAYGGRQRFPGMPEAFQRPVLGPDQVHDSITENMACSPWMPVDWDWGSAGPLPGGQIVQVFPNGELVLVVADPGTGKGQLIALYTACKTTGRAYPMMPAAATRPPRDVIIVAPEDNLFTTLKPRMLAAGADDRRIHMLTRMPNGQPFKLPSGLPVLMDAIRDLTSDKARAEGIDLGAVIFDPLNRCTDWPVSSDGRASAVLSPLMALAEKYHCPFIVSHHTNWDGGVNGSRAVQSIPRVLWMLYKDPEDRTGRSVLMSMSDPKGKGKSNITSTSQSLRFQIVGNGLLTRMIPEPREDVRRVSPAYQAAMAWQEQHAYAVITDAPQRPGVLQGHAEPLAIEASPVDRGGAQLAAVVGGNWEDPQQRDHFRAMAAAALKAASG